MKTLEIKIAGMDCAECASHVQKALSDLPQIESAQVFLGAEKAVIRFKNEPPTNPEIIHAGREYHGKFSAAAQPADIHTS